MPARLAAHAWYSFCSSVLGVSKLSQHFDSWPDGKTSSVYSASLSCELEFRAAIVGVTVGNGVHG